MRIKDAVIELTNSPTLMWHIDSQGIFMPIDDITIEALQGFIENEHTDFLYYRTNTKVFWEKKYTKQQVKYLINLINCFH